MDEGLFKIEDDGSPIPTVYRKAYKNLCDLDQTKMYSPQMDNNMDKEIKTYIDDAMTVVYRNLLSALTPTLRDTQAQLLKKSHTLINSFKTELKETLADYKCEQYITDKVNSAIQDKLERINKNVDFMASQSLQKAFQEKFSDKLEKVNALYEDAKNYVQEYLNNKNETRLTIKDRSEIVEFHSIRNDFKDIMSVDMYTELKKSLSRFKEIQKEIESNLNIVKISPRTTAQNLTDCKEGQYVFEEVVYYLEEFLEDGRDDDEDR